MAITTKAKLASTAEPTQSASNKIGQSAKCSDSKIAQVIALLEREEGATLKEMTDATSWQAHSARAALTGLRKKGHTIVKSRRDDVTCYRITGEG